MTPMLKTLLLILLASLELAPVGATPLGFNQARTFPDLPIVHYKVTGFLDHLAIEQKGTPVLQLKSSITFLKKLWL